MKLPKPRHGFKKGVSGNPFGRPKGSKNRTNKEIRELADPYALEAFAKLVTLMRSAPDPNVQRLAANDILNRRFGRPAQSVFVGGEVDLVNRDAIPRPKTFEELMRYALLTGVGPGSAPPKIIDVKPNGSTNGNGHDQDEDC